MFNISNLQKTFPDVKEFQDIDIHNDVSLLEVLRVLNNTQRHTLASTMLDTTRSNIIEDFAKFLLLFIEHSGNSKNLSTLVYVLIKINNGEKLNLRSLTVYYNSLKKHNLNSYMFNSTVQIKQQNQKAALLMGEILIGVYLQQLSCNDFKTFFKWHNTFEEFNNNAA